MRKTFRNLLVFCFFFVTFSTAQASTLDSIVIVKSTDGDSYGTGFVISPYGHIITNEHVIHGGKSFQICQRYTSEDPEVICYSDQLKLLAADSNSDLALLQLQEPTNSYDSNYLVFGDSNASKIGERISILGYPYDDAITLKVSTGLITKSAHDYILTDAQVSGGNSGSPVLNSKNEVIGIARAKAGNDKHNDGIIIPSNTVREWLSKINFNAKSRITNIKKIHKLPLLTARDGSFAVKFPGTPKFYSGTQSTSDGAVTINNYIYENNNKNEIISISYATLTENQLKEFNPEEQAKEFDSKVFGTTTIDEMKTDKLNKKIFYRAKTSKGYFATAQIYFRGTKFYQILFIKKGSYPNEIEVKNFIDSFSFL